MYLKVRVTQVVLQLPSKIYRSMFQLGNLDPSVMLVLARDTEVLDHHIRLLSERTVDLESSFCVDLGHFEKVACHDHQNTIHSRGRIETYPGC